MKLRPPLISGLICLAVSILACSESGNSHEINMNVTAFQSDFEKKLKPADPNNPYAVGYWISGTDSMQFLTDGTIIFAQSAGGACAEIDGVLRCFPVNGHYHVTYSGRNGNTLTYRLGKSVTGQEGENGNIRYLEGKELIIRFLTDTKISVSAGGIEQTYEYTLREAINDYPGP